MKHLSIGDTAMILIDYQVGTNTCSSRTTLDLLQPNVIALAKFAAGTNMPVVLTSSQETNLDVQGLSMPELADVLPDAFAARTSGGRAASMPKAARSSLTPCRTEGGTILSWPG